MKNSVCCFLFLSMGLKLWAGESPSAQEQMKSATEHYLDAGGEVSRMTMVQKNAKDRVLRTHQLILATRAVGDRFQTVIWVENDGTVFFADQRIAQTDPENRSWMYVPPIPGVKNSGKVFAVNQSTLQQPFIGSGFDVVDLERINIYDGERYQSAEEAGWIAAESRRYGSREILLDEKKNIAEIRYYRKGRLVKRSEWLEYEEHRPAQIRMERLRKNQPVHVTEIELKTRRGLEVPEEVFDRDNLRRVQTLLRELAETIDP
jgi:hypothetical protein